MPIRPGRTLSPLKSITRAPFGNGAEDGWTAEILPDLRITVSSAFGIAPVPSITRTWVSAIKPAGTATNGATSFPGAAGGGRTRASKLEALATPASSMANRTATRPIILIPSAGASLAQPLRGCHSGKIGLGQLRSWAAVPRANEGVP